jgi:hypothetical protein
MKISPEQFRDSLRESFLDLLWRQWRTLGVASHGAEAALPIDLEALILATAITAGQDGRLWDATLRWLAHFREWVNWARLKRMAVPFTSSDELLKRPLVKADAWRQACAVLDSDSPMRKERGQDAKTGRDLTPPRLRKPPLLQLFLRGIFGVNARAELMLFLLAEGEGNSNQIARETHYDQKNVYVILERWAGAGFIDREKRGKQNLYSLKPGSKAFLPAEIESKFWSWEPFFRTFGRLLVAVHTEPWRTDAYLLSSLFRSLHHDVSLFAKATEIVLPDPQLLPGEELYSAMAGSLARVPASF